jgi:DNA-binding transcriptional LysR family regulator
VQALAHLPVVAYAADLPIVRRYWRTEFGLPPPNEAVLIAPDLRAGLAAVVAGIGISVLPRYLADPAVAAGSVALVHRPAIGPLNTIYLATASGRPPGPAVDRTHRHLLACAREWGTF